MLALATSKLLVKASRMTGAKLLLRIIWKTCEQLWIVRKAVSDRYADGVPVRLRIGAGLHAQHRAGARPILDNDRLPHRIGNLSAHDTRKGIGDAPRRVGHDDANEAVRIGLRDSLLRNNAAITGNTSRRRATLGAMIEAVGSLGPIHHSPTFASDNSEGEVPSQLLSGAPLRIEPAADTFLKRQLSSVSVIAVGSGPSCRCDFLGASGETSRAPAHIKTLRR